MGMDIDRQLLVPLKIKKGNMETKKKQMTAGAQSPLLLC